VLWFSGIALSGYSAEEKERGSRLLKTDFHGWKMGMQERGDED